MVSAVALAPQCGLATTTTTTSSLSSRRSGADVRDIVSCSQSFFSGSGGQHLAVVGFGLRGGNAIGLQAERSPTKAGGIRGALFPFLQKKKDKEVVKKELLEAIAPLDRGAAATAEDIARVDEIARELEALNPTKEPLKSPFLNGKWELLYTTSSSILKKERPKLLRPNGAIYQAINTDTLRAQNLQTWPFFNQVTANLDPVNSKKVIVNFDFFKIGGLISVKAPGRARGELEITYLDDELRVSRGDRGNLFVLIMDDPTYRIPV
ncbi:hypothetical protein KC19_12G164400 [Ceratodon purpureus]|uniref:Plastid lipid-associated protein/fibrillin conserved domain-containing protein n=1 Tax=Ceratodon purpureus TaxID=3225 RepID=A0A8T0GAG7_CERPU|nr:hypothetical protein KC19_12G164400 [Ceratodon purpureus]